MQSENKSLTSKEQALVTAAGYWAGPREAKGTRWWMHSIIHQHINKLVCGEALPGDHAGFHRLIAEAAPEGGFQRGISIGCGSGGKEMRLLRSGAVQHFTLYEIGEHRRDLIRSKALTFGVADRIDVQIGDAFERNPSADFDLVYWNNALHHMFDADQAVSWSYNALRANGCFAADDFVGPSRFQWTDDELNLVGRIRSSLPDNLMIDPKNRALKIAERVARPDVEVMLREDPTESADSERILDAIRSTFKSPTIIFTGGVIYHLALNDVLANFDPENPSDRALLQCLLLLDETLAHQGHTHYAVAIAQK